MAIFPRSAPENEAVLLILNVAPYVWQAPVTSHPQVIGRLPECDIVIPGKYTHVSRQHALIGNDGSGIWIQDLGSLGGSQLNGIPLVADVQTRAIIGDRLSLGGLELYIVSSGADILHGEPAVLGSDPQMARTGLRLGMRRSIDSMDDVRLRCLSAAELEVIRWICRGLTTFEEIGKQLFRSPHTVRTQLGSVYRKLDVHSRDELVSWFKRCEISWTQPSLGNDFQYDLSQAARPEASDSVLSGSP